MKRTGLPGTAVGAGIVLLAMSGSVYTQPNTIETIVITSERQESELRDIPASIFAVGEDTLDSISHVHIGEVLNSVPGVVFNRGNGQESLIGIRSPVLTGAGSCGAFQMSQDGIPLRAAGFCNVNQMFEANTEQAGTIEIVRGPGSVLYGVNALHGAINVISPTLTNETGGDISIDAGPHEYARLNLGFNNAGSAHRYGIFFNGATDGGYKDDSGFGQQKLNLAHRYDGGGLRFTTVFAATNLNQETAGYLAQGPDAYENDALKKVNENPEAFRDARSVRLHSRIEGDTGNGTWMLTPYYRDTDMDFLMHFLPGTPLEENGHSSVGLQSMYSTETGEELAWIGGVDLEFTDGFLRQTQDGGFGPFPAGKQYDYQVDATLVSPYVQVKYQPNAGNQLSLGLRYEFLEYEYDNKMIDGNTAEDGTPCPGGACRYSRPSDRSDSFDNASIQLGWIHDFDEMQQLFVNLGHAFRAPQATEMYRLQVNQSVAELDSEQVDSIEAGFRASRERISYSLVAYFMQKDEVIFQDSDRNNVSGGETEHKGVELNSLFALSDDLMLNVAASYARHTFEANISPLGVTVPIIGNDIDEAPKFIANAQLDWSINERHRAELEWMHMGSYFTNETNLNQYDGHDVFNLRYHYQPDSSWYFSARLTNLFDEDYAERADFSGFSGDRYFVGEPLSLYLTVGTRF